MERIIVVSIGFLLSNKTVAYIVFFKKALEESRGHQIGGGFDQGFLYISVFLEGGGVNRVETGFFFGVTHPIQPA